MKELLLITIKKLVKSLLLFFFGIPAGIILRFLYPFVHIRVGVIPAERIGHFADDSMHFLCQKELNFSKRSMDIFFLEGPPCNIFFYKLIRRELKIYRFVEFLYKANFYLPKSSLFYAPNLMELHGSRDIPGLRMQTKKVFPFSEEENIAGEDFLKSIGCMNNQKFICLNIRDSLYLEEKYPDTDFSYHDYRDSDCQSYELAVSELISRGYFVIRMGSKVRKKLIIDNDQFLDYPFCSFASDFLDVWLMANCKFCISTSSGLDSISNIYRRPVAYVNALPIGDFNSSNPRAIWMPKTIVDSDNKILSIKELIDKQLIVFHTSRKLQKYNLQLIDNSPEEICEVASEIEEKIAGSWKASDQNIKKRKWVEDLLISSWEELNLYHDETIFQKKSFGHFSDAFLKKFF